MSFLEKIFGDANSKEIKRIEKTVEKIEALDSKMQSLSDEQLQAIDPRITKELLGDISIPACVKARNSFGGTAPDEVRRQISVGRTWLDTVSI